MGWERGRAQQSTFYDLLAAAQSKQHVVATSHSLSPSTIVTVSTALFLCIFPVSCFLSSICTTRESCLHDLQDEGSDIWTAKCFEILLWLTH